MDSATLTRVSKSGSESSLVIGLKIELVFKERHDSIREMRLITTIISPLKLAKK